MYDAEKYQDYIRCTIIDNLERLMGNEEHEEVAWHEKYPHDRCFMPHDATYQSVLHELMVPYYDKYLNGDVSLCRQNMEPIRWQMKHAIDDDDQFGHWASEQNLIDAAEGWGSNMQRIQEQKRIFQFFHVLHILLEKDCLQDWVKLSEELKQMLFTAEVYSDYKTDEVLCVLHAFVMIMRREATKQEKAEMLELLRTQWLFLKHYYSVMIRHIVGVKWTTFDKVAETVLGASASFKPHMHIFYSGLIDCVDKLQLDRKQQRKMDKIVFQMQEELNRCEWSELLYPLCDTLFPEDFQRLLREHRPKSYREIEDENREKDELIRQMQEQSQRTRKELERTRELFEKMVLSSIPIENIDAELEQYPPEVAWGLLRELQANSVISVQEAWREYYPELLRKYRARLWESVEQQKGLAESMMQVAERPTFGTYYAAGATHDDRRKQMMLGGEKQNLANLKQLSNE